MTVRRIPLADWLHHCRLDVAQRGCRAVGGFVVTSDYIFAQGLKERANLTAAHPEQSKGRPDQAKGRN